MHSKHIAFGALGVGGLALTIVGALILALFPLFLRNKIIESSLLVNASENFKSWQTLPLPALMAFHVFAPKNARAYTSLSDVEMEARGPWVFEEWRSKEELRWNDNHTLVSYRERKKYVFRADLSNGTLDDNITFVNAPIMGVLFNQVLPDAKMAFDMFADQLDDNEKSLFTTRRAGDLLLDGVDLKLVRLLAPLMPAGTGISMKKFSITGGRDFLADDRLTVWTGIGDSTRLGQIHKWGDNTMLRNTDTARSPIWPFHDDAQHSCLRFRGTDGTFFGPDVSPNDQIYAFDPSICRSVALAFQRESSVKDIPCLRFVTPRHFFGAAANHRENTCYCLKKNVSECAVDGLLELSHCLAATGGAPIVLSWPYFMDGDRALQFDNVRLVPPLEVNFDNYGTFLDIEPTTGAPLNAVKRMQLNVRIGHSDAIKQLNATRKGKDFLVPVLWVQQSGALSDEFASMFKSRLLGTRRAVNVVCVVFIIVGALAIVVAVFLVFKNMQ